MAHNLGNVPTPIIGKEENIYSTGPFPAILGKGPWLELGKICDIFGNFLEVLISKKTNKHLTCARFYSCVYERVISMYYNITLTLLTFCNNFSLHELIIFFIIITIVTFSSVWHL